MVRGDIVSLTEEGIRQCFGDEGPPDFYFNHKDWNLWRIDGFFLEDGRKLARVHVLWSEKAIGGEQFDVTLDSMELRLNGDPGRCWSVLGVGSTRRSS